MTLDQCVKELVFASQPDRKKIAFSQASLNH
jgi:hypothetical protein